MREDGTKPNEHILYGAGGTEPALAESRILCGHYLVISEFIADVVAQGWRLSYHENKAIIGGERYWWMLAGPSLARTEPPLESTGGGRKISVRKDGRAMELVNFVGMASEHQKLDDAISINWTLRLTGIDGGWGGEPYYEVERLTSRITLSDNAWEKLTKMLQNPPKPSKALKNLIRNFRLKDNKKSR